MTGTEQNYRMRLAGHAMQGLLARSKELPPAKLAELAVQHADAVMRRLRETEPREYKADPWHHTPPDRDHEAAMVDKLLPVPSGDGGGP